MTRHEERRFGVAMVVSGPSGTGKTTACRQLLQRESGLRFSVSCTTRPSREGEVDGRDYWFLDEARFRAKLQGSSFLEHAEVHGCRYGTLRREVEEPVAAGRDVLLDIDVEGARQVRRNTENTSLAGLVVYVFFAPPSLREVERRLRGRGTEGETVLARRLGNARAELAVWRNYDYLVVNQDLTRAVDDLQAILRASRCLVATCREEPWQGD